MVKSPTKNVYKRGIQSIDNPGTNCSNDFSLDETKGAEQETTFVV